ELPALDELERRGRANGVAGLRRVGPAELCELEPHATGIAALHSPGTAIVDFAAVARALAEDLRTDGAEVATGCPVSAIHRDDGGGLLGPSALLVPSRRALAWPGTWRLARRFWRTGLDELRLAAGRRAFVAACARYVPELTEADVRDGWAGRGVRAQAVGRDGTLIDDFVVHEAGGALHVRNAPSPAATSALALARLIADRADAALG